VHKSATPCAAKQAAGLIAAKFGLFSGSANLVNLGWQIRKIGATIVGVHTLIHCSDICATP
jgi:hypothetical protein